MRELLRRAWYLLRRRRREADLREELAVHQSMKQSELARDGINPAQAARAARQAFGSEALALDQSRDVWIPRPMQGLGQDVRVAFRGLHATPLVAAIAIASLALGIGASTAIFSILNSLVLRALPVVAPERLVVISSTAASSRGYVAGWTYGVWTRMLEHANPFDGALAWSTPQRFNLARGGEVDAVDGLYVSGSYFGALGVPAVLGRTLTSRDDDRSVQANEPVAVISYGLWQRHFGGEADTVGRSILIERVPFTIVGVTPPNFFGTEIGRSFDVAVPIAAEPLIHPQTWLSEHGPAFLTIMLRLKPGQSSATAAAAMNGQSAQVLNGEMDARPLGTAAMPTIFLALPAASGTSGLRTQYVRPLVTILAIITLVLIIACVNLANLVLARTMARRREFSVRLALGASAWRLSRPVLMEALLLSAAGATLGVLIAAWSGPVLVAQLSTAQNRMVLDVPIDWRVLAFAGLLTIVTTVLAGFVPALRAARAAPIEALREHGRDAGHGRDTITRGALMVSQVAVSVVVILLAGLLIRTLQQLTHAPLGFDADRVLVVNINAARTHVGAAGRSALYQHLVNEMARVPGVASAAGSQNTPVSSGLTIVNVVDVPGSPLLPDSEHAIVANAVTSGWFAAYGSAIRRGRDFTDHDTAAAPAVVVVNDAFVHRFIPDGQAIGKLVLPFGAPEQSSKGRMIVGVVGDAVFHALREGAPPTMYIPLAQLGIAPAAFNISVRATAGSPMLLARGISSTLSTIDPDLAFSFHPLADQVDASLTQDRVVAALAGFCGGLALLLAALGLYGVSAYAVSRRRTEIGIRLALGAQPALVVRLVMARTLLLVTIGVVAGSVGGLWAARYVASLLYGLTPHDPTTLAGAGLVLMVVAMIATGLPAWRASRIDPAMVLRNE